MIGINPQGEKCKFSFVKLNKEIKNSQGLWSSKDNLTISVFFITVEAQKMTPQSMMLQYAECFEVKEPSHSIFLPHTLLVPTHPCLDPKAQERFLWGSPRHLQGESSQRLTHRKRHKSHSWFSAQVNVVLGYSVYFSESLISPRNH